MKGMDLFCSSPASTAVISSMDVQRSMARQSPKSYGHDRRKSQPRVPCSSHLPVNPKPYYEKHRKSSAEKENDEVRSKSCVEVKDLYSHCSTSSSRRRLLSDAPFIDWVSQSDQITPVDRDDSPALRSSSSARSRNQVVVLRVSLHCKGCAAKVRKHISKMEGVTSFSIDMETKKVTILGDVTPLGVLASVSKVKNAQLWSAPTSSSSSSSMPMVDMNN